MSDIELLEKNLEGWKTIFREFERDPFTGMRYYRGLVDLCNLCPDFRVVEDDGDKTRLTCPECPIVRVSGETCVRHFRKLGLCRGMINEVNGLGWTKVIIESYVELVKKAKEGAA